MGANRRQFGLVELMARRNRTGAWAISEHGNNDNPVGGEKTQVERISAAAVRNTYREISR